MRLDNDAWLSIVDKKRLNEATTGYKHLNRLCNGNQNNMLEFLFKAFLLDKLTRIDSKDGQESRRLLKLNRQRVRRFCRKMSREGWSHEIIRQAASEQYKGINLEPLGQSYNDALIMLNNIATVWNTEKSQNYILENMAGLFNSLGMKTKQGREFTRQNIRKIVE